MYAPHTQNYDKSESEAENGEEDAKAYLNPKPKL